MPVVCAWIVVICDFIAWVSSCGFGLVGFVVV